MRQLISKIFRAIRRVLKEVRTGLGVAFNFADGLLGSMFGRREYEDEVVEISVEEAVMDEVEANPALAARDLSVAKRVKNALLAIDASRPVDREFDLSRPDHVLSRDWVVTLDETGLRALRHLPMPGLTRHLDMTDPFQCVGLPVFPVVANANANAKGPIAATGPRVRFQEVDEVERRQAFG